MIVRFDPRPEDLQRLQVGPIGPHLPSFAMLVSEQGYCNVTGWLKVRVVAKLSRWLQQRRIPLRELNEAQIATFFNARWKRLKRHAGDQTAMALLLRHLRQSNVVPPPAPPDSDIDLICVDYEGFLLRERSVMPSSAEKYLKAARRFLSDRFPSRKVYLKRLRARDVTDFLLHDSSNHLGTVHASAQLALAEASSGEFLLRYLGSTDGLVPVVRRLEAKFKKPANGAITSTASTPPETFAQLRADIAVKGGTPISIDVEVHDESGAHPHSARVEWFITRISAGPESARDGAESSRAR